MVDISKIFLALAVCFITGPSAELSYAYDPSPWDIQVAPKPSFYPGNRAQEVSIQRAKISKVTVYTKPFCAECDQAKEYLKGKGITFEEVDSLLTLTGVMSITLSSERPPIAIIDYNDGTRRRVSGFDKDIYDTVLGAYRSGGTLSDFDISGGRQDTQDSPRDRNQTDDSFDFR